MRIPVNLAKFSAFALAILSIVHFHSPANAQQIQWAGESDTTVQMLVEAERKWAIIECVPSDVDKQFLADEFVGTAPDGSRYSKADVLADPLRGTIYARECKLLSAHVRFIGDNLAMIYGSETSIRKDEFGKEFDRTLVWTDTWLKRKGKWQIIAVQDALATNP